MSTMEMLKTEKSKTEKSGIGMSKVETSTLWWGLVSWLSIWEFFYLSTLFWATCLKAMTHQCSNQIHPAQGFLGAKLIPKLIPRQRGWHSIQTPPAAAPSAPWSPPQAIKRGLVGNGGKSAGLAVLRGSNPNPYSLMEEESQTHPESQHSAGQKDVFSVVLGRGTSQCCPGLQIKAMPAWSCATGRIWFLLGKQLRNWLDTSGCQIFHSKPH